MIDGIIIVIYLILILLVGMLASRNLKTIDDFAISNVKYGKGVIFITMCCSFLGGGFSFGNATEVFKNGIGNIIALFGFSIGQIFLGKYIASKIEDYEGCISTGEVLGRVYGKKIRIITGGLSSIICAGILGAQVSVMGTIFETFMGIPSTLGITIGFGIILIYSTMGGIKADVITDIIQFVVLMIGMPILFIYGINSAGGIKNILTTIPPEYFNPVNGKSITYLLSMFFTLMLGEMLVPPYVQRLLMGKSAKETSKATVLSGYASIFFFIITGTMGLVAYTIEPTMDANLAMTGIIKLVLPIGLSGVIISAMMSIVLSTADSFLNSAAVGIVNDMYIPIKGDNVPEKKRLKIVRVTNLIIGISSILIAILIPDLIGILRFAYSFWAPTILPALLITLLDKKLNKVALWGGILSGLIVTTYWTLILNDPYGINGLIVGFLVNVIISLILNIGSKVRYIRF